jgi:hypothetical protein
VICMARRIKNSKTSGGTSGGKVRVDPYVVFPRLRLWDKKFVYISNLERLEFDRSDDVDVD